MIGHQYRGSWPQGNHGPPHQRGRQVSQEQILERIHGNLYSIVGEAVDDVKVEEDKWSRTEIVKRIVGYIYKAAKTPDLMHKPWQEISKTIVHHGMGSYVSACSEKPWFYQLALGNAFTSAVWELVQASARGRPQVHFQDVQDFVVREFEQHLDKSLLTKAVWDATMLTFKDRDIQPKIFKAVHNTYQPALDELLADTRPIDDARKVETFTRRWMETSMQRAWSALESAEQVLSTGQVIRLFQNLIAPFGEGHEYTCIPSMLVDQIGRPPRNWKFLRTAVSKMFEEWHAAQTAPQPSKRRKKGGGGGGEEPEEAEEQEATRDDEEEVPAEEENPPEEEELGDFAAENGTNGAKATFSYRFVAMRSLVLLAKLLCLSSVSGQEDNTLSTTENPFNPYKNIPTIAPGMGFDGKPVAPILWDKNPFSNLNSSSFSSFGKQIKNAFHCPFATCTGDVILDDDNNDWWRPWFIFGVVVLFVAGLFACTPFTTSWIWGRFDESDEEDEEEGLEGHGREMDCAPLPTSSTKGLA